MKYTSGLIERIITSPSAKKGLDYITPIYHEAYVALWLMQAIGLQTDLILKWIDEYKKQILPQTASWALPYFEEEYGIPINTALSYEERRKAILLAVRTRAPVNPVKLGGILSVGINAEVSIRENTGKNAFSAEITDVVSKEQIRKMKDILDIYKPAHLIYWFNSIIKLEFYNENIFLVKNLIMLTFFSNLGVETVFLDGKRNLDGMWNLQTETKGIELSGLTLSGSVINYADIIIKSEFSLIFKNAAGGNKSEYAAALRYHFENAGEVKGRRLALVGNFNENEELAGCVALDTMWRLDGENSLDDTKKLNADTVKITLWKD